MNPAAFIRDNTIVKPTSLVPEIRLHLADAALSLWQKTEDDLAQSGLPPPYWAFAWAGGQALARYVIDTPYLVAGKRVLDLASGSGIAGLAALWASAATVVASDIDAYAVSAIQLNAAENNLETGLDIQHRDLIGEPTVTEGGTPLFDVVLAGDVCYEAPMAEEIVPWLRRHAAAGATVLLGDPGRSYVPKAGLVKRAEYAVPVPRDLEDGDLRRTVVWEVLADGEAGRDPPKRA